MALDTIAGWSALLAAVATVVGAVFLVLFFSRGGIWGLLNDVASIVLMLATIPVALVIASFEDEPPLPSLFAWISAVIGIAGMVIAALAQALLVGRIRTYRELLRWTLGGGAIVGVWYVLIGSFGFRAVGGPLAPLAIVSGLGFIAIGYGFAVGNERHPLSVGGGIVLFVASTAFLAWIGLRLISGDLL